MSAIVNALLDGVPTLFIVAPPPLREAEDEPSARRFRSDRHVVSADQMGAPHHQYERIPDLTAMAVRKAMTGRRGAVLLELPIDRFCT